MEAQHLFIGENEKSFIITKPKIASRFIQGVYTPTIYDVVLDSSDLSLLHADSHVEGATEMLSRLFNRKTNTKDIFIIYRHPLTRYISGLVEDVFVSIGTNNFSGQYHLRPYLKKNNIDPYVFYNKLKVNDYNRDFLLEPEFIGLLNDVLDDFFYWQVQTIPTRNSHHSSPYMSIYDRIIKSDNIDERKIHLVNIDNHRNDLTKILEPYSDDILKVSESIGQVASQSHKKFKSHIATIIESNIFFKELVNDICGLDFYFYDEFEKSPLNILNSEIRN